MIPDEQPHIQKSVLYGKNDTTEDLLYSKETVVLTPKRGVGGSNPLMDASEQRRKPLFVRAMSQMASCLHEQPFDEYRAVRNFVSHVKGFRLFCYSDRKF